MFITPLLPTILLSIALGISFLGLFGIDLLVYSFLLAGYMIMRDLLDNHMIRAEEERKNQVSERHISLIETKDAEK